MLKLLLLAVCLTAVSSNTEWFTGKWLPVVRYPNTNGVPTPMCHWNNVTTTGVKCSCGDKTDIPQVNILDVDTRKGMTLPVITVHSAAEVSTSLALKCTCGGVETPAFLFRKFGDTHQIAYGMRDGEIAAVVAVRKVPKEQELRDFIQTVEDLKTREPEMLCNSKFFDDNNKN